MDELEKYPFCGHSVIMGKCGQPWQDIKTVLSFFGKTMASARRSYRSFVSRGIEGGRGWDLTGGGLIRSTGGWASVKALKKEKVPLKSDERVLGDGDFVEKMLAQSRERYESRHALQARGIDVDHLAARIAELLGISVEQVWQPGKARPQVKARRLLCYWAVCELGETMTAMAGRLGLSTAAVSMAVVRGAEIAKRNGYPII